MSELEKARAALVEHIHANTVRRIETFVDAILDAREAKAPFEERIRALELIAFPAVREAKAPVPDDGGKVTVDVLAALGYLQEARAYANNGSGGFKHEGATLGWALDTLRARISELEREWDEIAIDRDAWRSASDRIEADWKKAEASLAELRGRVEKAAEELMFIPFNSGSMRMPEARGHVMAALMLLVPNHPLLLTDPPPPAGDEPATNLKGATPARDGDEPPVPGTNPMGCPFCGANPFMTGAARSAGIGGPEA